MGLGPRRNNDPAGRKKDQVRNLCVKGVRRGGVHRSCWVCEPNNCFVVLLFATKAGL